MSLLRNEIRDVELSIQQGLTCINWLSSSIQKYCNNCNLKLNYLHIVYNQINHIEKDILERIIQDLINYNFFYYKNEDSATIVLNCKDYFEQIEQTRIKLINQMKQNYETIGRHLIKIETLILNTHTGKSNLMKLTYQHWEREVYKGLTEFVLKNLDHFLMKLKSLTKQPVFEIDATLIRPDICLVPAISEIFNIIIKSIRDFLNYLKIFMRWMDGTCLLCPYQTNYSFYNDIINNVEINELIRKIQEITQFSIMNVHKYLQRFRHYRNLWVFDKSATCQKFLERYQYDLNKLDERFVFYTNIINDLDNINNHVDIGCVRLNLVPLLNIIKQHTIEWRTILGQSTDKFTKESMNNMKYVINDLKKKLNQPITNFDEFKLVMETIKSIWAKHVIFEIKYKNFQQSYELLKLHQLDYNLDNEIFSELLEKQWTTLHLSSINRYIKLEPIRQNYCRLTVDEIEKFLLKLQQFIERYNKEGPGSVPDPDDGLLLIDKYRDEFRQYEQQRQEFIKLEYLFNITTIDYNDYLDCKYNFELLLILYKFYEKFQESKEIWGRTLWSDLNTDELLNNTDLFIEDFNKIQKNIREFPIGRRIYEKLEQFKRTISLMLWLKNPALRDRHWLQLMKLTETEFDSHVFNLNNVFQMHLYRYEAEINVILTYAVNEARIEDSLQKIIKKWINMDFILKKYKNYYILDLIEDFLKILEDDLISLHNMLKSIYVQPFQEEIKFWQHLLINVTHIIDELIILQNKWLNLENSFNNNPDLQQQLPDGYALFTYINQQFCKIIDEIRVNPNILRYCKRLEIISELQSIQKELDKCQKSLNQYLELKRQQAPRFYLLSDDELLIVISDSDNHQILQKYIVKLFNNIKALRINNDTKMITALISCEDEILEFVNPIDYTKKFEEWLNDIVREMLKTVRYLLKRTIFNYGKTYYKSRIEYLFKYQTIICLTNNLIWWTLEVEYVFKRRDKMNNYLKQLNQQLDDILKAFDKSLSNHNYLKLRQILTVDLHQRDITDNLILLNPQSSNDFEWTKELRFYWLNDVDNLIIKQLTATFEYGYEFMGLNNCFILTPLTDRVYLTITQTLMMNFNCLLYGRYNCGKTDTIKSLATTFGILCLIINCCYNFNPNIITRYLNGLIQCGIWGCFEQFNHINNDTLSIISTQLQTVHDAVVAKFDKFQLEDSEIFLNHKFGIFFTLDENYQLLETIKQLSRPIVCVNPDIEQICSIELYSYGLKDWRIWTRKLLNFHQLAKELLSKQEHYDFSLSSISSILTQINKLLRESIIHDELTIVIKALIDVNLPKLIDDDLPIFYNLIHDLFPGVDYRNIPKSLDIQKTVETILTNDGYLILAKQIEKILQINELLTIKYSLMLIGPSGGGKSVIINTLIKTRIKRGSIIKSHFINPKALTLDGLYGSLNVFNKIWSDGLLPTLLRDMEKVDDLHEFFIIFDGDVDVVLVEQLNTLLDDSQRFLTLINGERLHLNDMIYFIYETGDLTHTTPAFITKITMIYIEGTTFNYQSYWNFWVNTKIANVERRQIIEDFYQQFIHPLLNGDYQLIKTIIPLSHLNLIKQVCCILDAMDINNHTIDNDLLLPIFIDSVYNSIGLLLIDDDYRQQFDEFVKKQSQLNNIEDDIDNRCDYTNLPTNFPTLFDYYFDKTEQNWIAYDWILPKESYENLKFSQIFVPTRNTIRVDRLLKLLLIDNNRPVCLIGEPASSKTVTVENFLKSLNLDEYLLLNINFSRNTTSKQVEKQIALNLISLTKNVCGPLDGKKLICFIDDLNRSKVDDYGTQQPVAFLKSLLQYNGYYETENYEWKNIENVNYITVLDQQKIDQRFLSLLTIINVIAPDTTILYYIYRTILEGFLSNFDSQLQIADRLMKMTLNVYNFIRAQFPPTPHHFFYIFNMRDLSRIIAGLYQIHPESFTRIEQLVRVWRHEITRVFCDCLYDKDRDLVSREISKQIENMFRRYKLSVSDYALRDPLLFGDYRNALSKSPRQYEDLLDYSAVHCLFEEILDEYNRQNDNQLDLMIFNDVLEYLTRIHRVIRLENGHIIIIGNECCGKTFLTRLVTFTANYQLFTLVIDRNYDEDRFKEELKHIFQQCGLEHKQIVFYCKSVDIKFMEYFDNIVKFGKIPLLYSEIDRKVLIEQYRSKFNENTATNEEIWMTFLDKCRENFHVIMSTTLYESDKLRKFPNLINCTTINLMAIWPKRALHDIASVYIKDNPLFPEDLRHHIMHQVVNVHWNFTHDYSGCTTFKHYLDLIQIYLKLLEEKIRYIDTHHERLTNGLKKIDAISEELNNFNEILAQQQIILQKSFENCEKMLKEIEENKRAAEEKKIISSEKSIEIEEKINLINLEQIEAEKILAMAIPKLEQARLSLNDLNKLDITEIRSFPTPPEPVKILVECIALLFGYKEVNWKIAKGMMADPRFLIQLQEIDCNQITLEQQRLVKGHMKQTKQLDKMKQISKAADNLLRYLYAILEYCDILRDVRPKQQRVEQLQNELAMIKQYLEKLNLEIIRIEEQLILLNKQYQESIEKRESLQRQIDFMLSRFELATKLTSDLKSDRQHWAVELQELEMKKHNSTGNCLLTAIFLNYCGSFGYETRQHLINNYENELTKKRIPVEKSFKLTQDILYEIDKNLIDLDDLTQQNCALLMKTLKSPLCVDPQQQALKLINTVEKTNDLQILHFNDQNFLITLETALITGIPTLIEDVDECVDPVIYGVLRKNIQIVNNNPMIFFNGKQVEFNENFRLYLTTKLRNPQFSPTIHTTCTVINCTISVHILEEQLLNSVVKNERPDIAAQHGELLKEISTNKISLKDLKDILLIRLTTTTGHLLDNLETIEALDDLKLQIHETTSKLQSNEETLLGLQHLYNNYRSVSKMGANIFFIMFDLSNIHQIYQYSLIRYLEIFTTSMKKAQPSIILTKRLANIKMTLIKLIYEYGCASVLQQHKLFFAFLITLQLQLDANQLKQPQIDFLVRGSYDIDEVDDVFPNFLTQRNWNNIKTLCRDFPETFSHLPFDIKNNEDEWQRWYDSEKPESMLPSGYQDNLKIFEVLMLLRCTRIDRLYLVADNFIRHALGDEFTEPPSINFDEIYKQSTCFIPVLFILNFLQDPVDDLKKLSVAYNRQFDYLSLGEARVILAMSLLETAIIKGQWLFLQNCQLLPNFIKTIEWKIKQFDRPHPDFRLWLSTEPIDNFPVSILRDCVKIVLEPSHSFQSNLRNTYTRLDAEILDSYQHDSFKKLIFVLVFFNGVVQERRKFNKIGWNVYYDFSQSDFDVSVKILEQCLMGNSENLDTSLIPWNCLKYLIGDVIYGGRVIDEFDRRLLKTYVNEYIGDFLFNEFEPFHFYSDATVDYALPPDGNKDDYIAFINEFPAYNGPEVYGLNSNAEFEYYTRITKELAVLLKRLQPHTATNTTASIELDRDETVKNITYDILSRIPLQYEIGTIREFYQRKMTPTVIVLLQELHYFNKLIETMQQTLTKLLKALNGNTFMITELNDMANSLFNGQLPKSWRRVAPDTCKNLGDWLAHFQRRQEQYQPWTINGEPTVLWISGLHYPGAYLTALIQFSFRLNDWPLDQYSFYTNVTKFFDPEDVTLKPAEGNCLMYGLHLNGASWDLENQCLMQSAPKVLVEKMPVMTVIPIEIFRLKLQNTLKTPVYTTSQRCNVKGEGLSFEINLNTKKHVSHWILQGVCLILNTD